MFTLLCPKIFAPIACPSKGRRRSNLQRVPQNFQNLTVYRSGIKKNCDKPLILQDGRYVLKYWRPARPWKKECTPKTTRVGPCRDTYKEPTPFCSLCFSKHSRNHKLSLTIRRRSNFNWGHPRRPGTASCTTRTTMGTAPLPSTSQISQCTGPEMNCDPM